MIYSLTQYHKNHLISYQNFQFLLIPYTVNRNEAFSLIHKPTSIQGKGIIS